jgi:hypothetical protein
MTIRMIMILFGLFKSQKPLFGFTLKYIDKLIPIIAIMPIKISINVIGIGKDDTLGGAGNNGFSV